MIMKKNFLYFGMAACVAMCMLSCGSDDSDSPATPSQTVIAEPTHAKDAVAFVIPKDKVTSTQTVTNEEGQEVNVCLTSVDITEGQKAVFELTTETEGKTKLKYVAYNCELTGNVYTVKDNNGKVLGTIEKDVTRGSSSVSISISVKINVPGLGEVEFVTDDPVVVQAVVDAIVKTVNTINLCRNWNIQRMKLTLVFDDKNKADASRLENSGNLSNFIELAENNGVNLTDNDKKHLQKTISSVDIDKNLALFTINYSNGESDAANWEWVNNTNEQQIRIKLKDGDMGNKFLKDNSVIEVQFPEGQNMCILILSTRLEEDKCTASLMINLK